MSTNQSALNWRNHLQVHPAADQYPLMAACELQALADDIKSNGLRQPLVLWHAPGDHAAALLDGRNRLDAMALAGMLGVSEDDKLLFRGELFQVQRVSGDPYALALSLNLHRRHLTSEQKHELIAKVLKEKPELSDRQIGNMVKASKNTVAADRAKLEARGQIDHAETRTDTKGRQQPAKKMRAATDDPAESAERMKAAHADAAAEVPDDPPEDHDGDDVADPAEIEESTLYLLERMSEHARVARKWFKLTSFDHDQKKKISAAIDGMIKKWRLAQTTLTKQPTSDETAP